jgi:hypothetical protein
MDIFFQDPSETPLPPAKVRIRELRADPWPDGKRVRVYMELDPFQQRPNADITIENSAGDDVAQVSIIESMTRKIELTMHLHGPMLDGRFKVIANLYYTEPLQEPKPGEEGLPARLPASTMVDRTEITFAIEGS